MLNATLKRHTDPCYTKQIPVKLAPMRHHDLGLSWTASGYGARIPTRYMVHDGRTWRRVYCRIYSNIGTLFVGRSMSAGSIVDIWET